MKKGFLLGQNEFDALLSLLSPNRDEAGEIYERLRQGLMRFFRYKGCTDTDDLVDETFNRVAARTDKFDRSLNHDPDAYFYGFAALIALEHKRKAARLSSIDVEKLNGHGTSARHEAPLEDDLHHLQHCLGRLDEADRDLVTEYYSLDGHDRIDLRHQMAERMKCSPSALYVRVCRIRARLKNCVEGRKNNNKKM